MVRFSPVSFSSAAHGRITRRHDEAPAEGKARRVAARAVARGGGEPSGAMGTNAIGNRRGGRSGERERAHGTTSHAPSRSAVGCQLQLVQEGWSTGVTGGGLGRSLRTESTREDDGGAGDEHIEDAAMPDLVRLQLPRQ